jgi:mevalonate pyrophosphate decarboxylase
VTGGTIDPQARPDGTVTSFIGVGSAASAVAAMQASVHKRLGSGAASEPKKLCKCDSKPSGSGSKPTAGVSSHCW